MHAITDVSMFWTVAQQPRKLKEVSDQGQEIGT